MRKSNYNSRFLGIIFLTAILGMAFINPALSEELPLEVLVKEVKVALLKVQQNAAAENLPPLEKVELEINAVQKTNGEGKVSFFIFEFGGGAGKETTHNLKLILKPPPKDSGSDVSAIAIAEQLAESILAGAKAIAFAKQGLPPLLANSLVSNIKFALKYEGGGKLKIMFPPFEAGGGGTISSAAIQGITVTYKY